MNKLTVLFLTICLYLPGVPNGISQTIDTVNYVYDNGIYFERHSDTVSETKFTDDNLVYKAHNKYFFRYNYKDKYGIEYLFETTNGGWNFIPLDSITDNTVTTITMLVMPDLGPYAEFKSWYSQSVIQYLYLSKDNKVLYMEQTGLVENLKNIWMHPPRQSLFKILETNPFPFIQKPYIIGNEWNWNLQIGDIWGDSRWKSWEGLIENHYTYIIEEIDKPVITPFGETKCYVIKSIAESELGTTKLTAYYNNTYGFVRLEYTNIDNSTVIIELEKPNDFDENQ